MSRTKWLTLVGMLAIAAMALLSQQTSEDETMSSSHLTQNSDYSFSNGKAWKTVGLQSRIMWVQGIEEGMAFTVREVYPRASTTDRVLIEKEFNGELIHGFRVSDVVRQINGFYEDTSNLRIPVVDAYKYTIKKMHGAKQQELEDFAADLRQRYNR